MGSISKEKGIGKYLTNIEKTKLTDSVIWIGEKVVKE